MEVDIRLTSISQSNNYGNSTETKFSSWLDSTITLILSIPIILSSISTTKHWDLQTYWSNNKNADSLWNALIWEITQLSNLTASTQEMLSESRPISSVTQNKGSSKPIDGSALQITIISQLPTNQTSSKSHYTQWRMFHISRWQFSKSCHQNSSTSTCSNTSTMNSMKTSSSMQLIWWPHDQW